MHPCLCPVLVHTRVGNLSRCPVSVGIGVVRPVLGCAEVGNPPPPPVHTSKGQRDCLLNPGCTSTGQRGGCPVPVHKGSGWYDRVPTCVQTSTAQGGGTVPHPRTHQCAQWWGSCPSPLCCSAQGWGNAASALCWSAPGVQRGGGGWAGMH